MIYFHYCQPYLQSKTDQFDKVVRKKLTEYTNRDSLRGINSIASYTGKIFVLNISSPHLKVILEEQRLTIGEAQVIVYFVRDLAGRTTTSTWLQNYVQIRDGKWLEYNPLPEHEMDAFLNALNIDEGKDCPKKEFPPHELVKWHENYTLKVEYDIYESEEWVKFAMNNSTEDGMVSDDAKLYKLALVQLSTAEYNTGAKYEILASSSNYEVKSVELNEVCIFYYEVIFNTFVNPIFLLINGANIVTQQNHHKTIRDGLKESHNNIDSFGKVQRLAIRAYPKWALNDSELWKAIQKNSETGNLSLLPEQTVFLKEFTFPKYINGQAGSGKSTMLYYLFANTYYFKCFDEVQGDIIFLTENENLLKHTKKSVIELLQCNPEFELSYEDISNVDKHFVSFKEFLLSHIPDNVDLFRTDKYLDFSKFKILYEGSPILGHTKKKYSAELIWFTLSTYVNGYDLDFSITSENYEDKMPAEGKKLIAVDDLKIIERDILPFYRKLIDDGYWDKVKIIRYIKQNNINDKQYDVIFCDEAQDFSRVELRFILGLSTYLKYDLSETKQVPIVFAGDALQTVNPTGFRAAEVKDMLYDQLKEIAHFKLDTDKIEYAPEYNYRSSQPIVNVANAIQYWRKKNFDAILKKPQIAKRPEFGQDNHLNIFIDFDAIEDNSNDVIGKLKYKIFIIPVNFHEKEEYIRSNSILKFFPEANIKTAVEAKGIDYDQVVLFGFGDYSEVVDGMEEYEKRFFYNKLYVAVTRAQFELIILDSKNSEENFWKKIIDFYADSSWSEESEVDKKDIKETIVFGATQIPQIIQSTPEMALENAKKDKDQGIYTKNPFLLRIAAHEFLKLGNKVEHFMCLALMHRFKEEWLDAAKFYLKKEIGPKGVLFAADIYWEGKLLTEFLSFNSTPDTEEHSVKATIAKSLVNISLEYPDLKSLHERRNKLRLVLYDTPWRMDIINFFLDFLEQTSDSERIRLIIDIFEEVCNDEYTEVWKNVGIKNLQIKRFEYAIAAFERCLYEGEFFIQAKIEISKSSHNVIEEVFWLGNLIREYQNTPSKEIPVRQELLELYEKNKSLFSSDQIELPQSLLYILDNLLLDENRAPEILGFIILSERVFIDVQKKINELIGFYFDFLAHSKRNSNLFQFILNRWVRASWLKTNDITELNEKYKKLCSINKIKFHAFSEQEIKRIPFKPTTITSEPPDHFRNVTIRNFRKLKNVSVENLGLINLVVGDNNVGKTTFLESLLFTSDSKELLSRLAFAFIERKNLFPLTALNSESPTQYYVLNKDFLHDYLHNGVKNKPIEYVLENNRSEWTFSVCFDNCDAIEIPKDAILFTDEDWEIIDELKYNDAVKTPLIAYGRGFGADLAKSCFDEILSKPAVETLFMDNMKLFIPTIERIIADTATGAIHIYDYDFPEMPVPLHQYGEGANKLFRILIFLTVHRGKKVLIDEIDAGIHFTRFKDFWRTIILAAIANDTQIVATTHNDECVKYYSEILEEFGSEIQRKSRVIQLKMVDSTLKIRSYEFPSFSQAIESNFELRGGTN